jgi:hypothetical protein
MKVDSLLSELLQYCTSTRYRHEERERERERECSVQILQVVIAFSCIMPLSHFLSHHDARPHAKFTLVAVADEDFWL